MDLLMYMTLYIISGCSDLQVEYQTDILTGSGLMLMQASLNHPRTSC